MKTVRIKKGYRLPAVGAVSKELRNLAEPDRVAFVPKNIRYVKPRFAVKVGDAVAEGSLLFEDKHRRELKFRSPGAGTVEAIRFGPRRVLEEIVIRLDPNGSHDKFGPVSDADLEKMDRAALIGRIQEGGLWALIRELPFRNIPKSTVDPPGIVITLGTAEPFEPDPAIYLKGREDLFQFGIRVLKKLTPDVDVVVGAGRGESACFRGVATHAVIGEYPSGDAGVFVYHTKKDVSKNRSWYVDGQGVLALAYLLREGRYPTERIVALAGSGVEQPCHVVTRMGVPLRHLTGDGVSNEDRRFVVGGLFTGYGGAGDGYLSFHETAVTVLLDDGAPEFLSLFNPGYRKPSYSRAFLSRLNRSPLPVDSRYHGDDRACIACGYCAEVCPVDIFPQFAYKAAIVGEMEEALEHGILDCVECGLCSHVCPSKIELTETFRNSRSQLYREKASR